MESAADSFDIAGLPEQMSEDGQEDRVLIVWVYLPVLAEMMLIESLTSLLRRYFRVIISTAVNWYSSAALTLTSSTARDRP